MKTLLIASTALFGLSAPAAALAQAGSTVDPVVVTGVASIRDPATVQATIAIDQTPGGVEVAPDTAFKAGPAIAIKDILAYVPGVVTQPRYGPDARISIRGSGLSRAYGNRGLNAYVDGVPINTSDGLLDLSEVDPTAYRYVEVFKGANALRFGGDSLGGAINFVTPTGRDASRFDGRLDGGSFGFVRGQASTGGVAGPWDGFVTLSAQREDGYRQHSSASFDRFNANVGYQATPILETRFYLNAYMWRSHIPGEVSEASAWTDPQAANPAWVLQDQQRNIDSVRLANKTTLRLDHDTIEFGLYGLGRHVMHPIYQWLDFTANDYGGFLRDTDERTLGGLRNRLVVGVNLNDGKINTKQYVNAANATKGALTASMVDTSHNDTAYAEDSLFLKPNVSLIAGVQFLHATRDRRDRFLSDGNQSGSATYDLWSPKVGLLWEVDPAWQVFANVSGSAEAPSYDTNPFSTPSTSTIKAQTATTYELGTRGHRGEANWDVSIYRSDVRNELQCLTTGPFSPCATINAGRTVHQGVEAGGGAPILKSALAAGDSVWVNAAYTFNDFKFDGDRTYGNKELPGVPHHVLRAEALYRHPSGFYAGPNVEWAPGHYFADNANTVAIDAYALLGLRVGFDAKAGWSVYVEGRNLTDDRYISTVAIAGTATTASQLFNPGTGRSVYSGARYRW